MQYDESRRDRDSLQILCSNQVFTKLVTSPVRWFVYCGFFVRRNSHLFRLECRPLIHQHRNGVARVPEAVSDRMTHEFWFVSQRKQNNSPIRLIFRHQYDFSNNLLDNLDLITDTSKRFKQTSLALNQIDSIASFVCDGLAFAAQSFSQVDEKFHDYLQRRSLGEIMRDKTLTHQQAIEKVTIEHRSLDLFWAMQTRTFYERYIRPDKPSIGYHLDNDKTINKIDN